MPLRATGARRSSTLLGDLLGGRGGPAAARDRPSPRQGHVRADGGRARRRGASPAGAPDQGAARCGAPIWRWSRATRAREPGRSTPRWAATTGRPSAAPSAAARRARRAPTSRCSSCWPTDALVEARLETGRTHQVRAHFAAIGHPVAGDPRYGQRRPPRPGAPVPAQRRLGFRHPFTGRGARAFAPTLPRGPGRRPWLGRADGADRATRQHRRPATTRVALKSRPTRNRPLAGRHGALPGARLTPGPRGAARASQRQSRQGSLMPEPGIKELLEAGLHFGHQTRRWDPRMRPYIFGERDGIHIIDLLQTEHLLAEARRFAADVASKGGTILFVGTKKQARDSIKEWAERCGHAVRQPALARRAADQLPHDVGADRPPARADRAAGRGPARPAADQGADGARGRAREARVQPRRRSRDEAPAAGGADHRPEDRGDRGARGRAPANPDHRPGRLERRPGARSTSRSRATTTRSAPASW